MINPNQHQTGNRPEPAPGCNAISAEMLSIDNLTRVEQIQTRMIGATRQILGQRLPETSAARRRISQRLDEVDWLVHSRDHEGRSPSTAVEADRLDYQRLRRQDINDAVELFGREIDPFNPVFVDYAENYALYNPAVDPSISVGEAVGRIFVVDVRKEHIHIQDQHGRNFRCGACRVARINTFMTSLGEGPDRERQFQTLRDEWLAELSDQPG